MGKLQGEVVVIMQRFARNPAIQSAELSPLSCRSGIGEHLPFAHSFVCKVLICSGFVA
jgi:hypothetical protein